MIFSSSLFLLYFLPIFLLTYWITPSKFKNIIALLGSIFFYAWGAPKFIFILLASSYVDFYVCKLMYIRRGKVKKYLLYFLVGYNVALLGYFKYANFFVDNLNQYLEFIGYSTYTWTKVILPIGISFFTFQKISYIVDVYRNVKKPLKKALDYLLFVLLFPQLIAGPIVRFNDIADEIRDRRKNETIDYKFYGIFRFTIGLAKKVLIANVLGEYVEDMLRTDILSFSTGEAWLVMVGYSLQIYYDFSGYSDMAIGLGMFMGFNFPENFNFPYISKNITEFWRRWHITLGAWMKEYLYIPLGGNKGTKIRVYLNLWIVFLLSGIWHGDSWNFLIWGAYNGFFLILDRLFWIRISNFIPSIFRILINGFVVLIGWVFFRLSTFEEATQMLTKLFSISENSFDFKNINFMFFPVLAIGMLFSVLPILINEKKLNALFEIKQGTILKSISISLLILILFLMSEISLTSSGFNPFIYFKF